MAAFDGDWQSELEAIGYLQHHTRFPRIGETGTTQEIINLMKESA